MKVAEFNRLLKLKDFDKVAKFNLCKYSLAVIKYRLLSRGAVDEIESVSHSVLLYFLDHVKDYVFAPVKYLYKCTDNFLSNTKKKEQRCVSIKKDVGYEQYFEHLENSEIFDVLAEILGKLNAQIIFMHIIDGAKEYEIAQKLNLDISYDAIRQRICRCKIILKEKLKHKFIYD